MLRGIAIPSLERSTLQVNSISNNYIRNSGHHNQNHLYTVRTRIYLYMLGGLDVRCSFY